MPAPGMTPFDTQQATGQLRRGIEATRLFVIMAGRSVNIISRQHVRRASHDTGPCGLLGYK